jgi:uncharacterized iron-regulated membrane protein
MTLGPAGRGCLQCGRAIHDGPCAGIEVTNVAGYFSTDPDDPLPAALMTLPRRALQFSAERRLYRKRMWSRIHFWLGAFITLSYLAMAIGGHSFAMLMAGFWGFLAARRYPQMREADRQLELYLEQHYPPRAIVRK